MIWKLLTPLFAYLLGNFNAGIIFSRLFFRKDLREHGSKNPGTTNAFRVLGKASGFLVLFTDALKGAAAIFLTKWLLPDEELWLAVVGFCVTLGHIFPVFFKFRGGKGVATTAGVTVASQPKVLVALLGQFFVILFGTRYMSLASIISAALLPLVSLAFHHWQFTPLVWMGLAQGIVIIAMHHTNIKRLLRHEENQLFNKKSRREAL